MMKTSCRLLSMLMCLCTLLSMILLAPLTAYAAVITDADEIRGSDFTDRPELAQMIGSIALGNASVYSDYKCTKLVNTAIGTRSVPNNGVTQYVGTTGRPKNSGTSCWIYANGCYFTLWGEATGNGTPGPNSEKLSLSGTDNLLLCFENLQAWRVMDEPGVLLKVGSHILFILEYTRDYIIYLDGNGDGKGLVALRKLTWAEVRKTNAIKGNVKYIIQPKLSHLNKLYPLRPMESSCAGCRTVKITPVNTTYTGYAVVDSEHVNGANIRVSPTSNCKGSHAQRIPNGTKVEILGMVRNDLNNLWWLIRYQGQTWYIFHSSVQLLQSDISIRMTAVPKSLQKGKSFHLAGTFSSNYPITSIHAQVIRCSDGKVVQSTVDKTNATHLSIRYLNANQRVRFGYLAKGTYLYKLTVTDSSGNTCTASYEFTVR